MPDVNLDVLENNVARVLAVIEGYGISLNKIQQSNAAMEARLTAAATSLDQLRDSAAAARDDMTGVKEALARIESRVSAIEKRVEETEVDVEQLAAEGKASAIKEAQSTAETQGKFNLLDSRVLLLIGMLAFFGERIFNKVWGDSPDAKPQPPQIIIVPAGAAVPPAGVTVSTPNATTESR